MCRSTIDRRPSFPHSVWPLVARDDRRRQGSTVEKTAVGPLPGLVRLDQRGALQVARVPAVGILDNRGGWTVSDDPAVTEDKNTISVRKRKIHIVRYKEQAF